MGQDTREARPAKAENSLAVPKRIRVNIFFDDDVDVAIDVAAASRRLTKSALVQAAVKAYLHLDTAAA